MNRVKLAYCKGYDIVDGVVIGVRGKELSTYIGSGGYLKFNYYDGGTAYSIEVHRLVAYKKFES